MAIITEQGTARQAEHLTPGYLRVTLVVPTYNEAGNLHQLQHMINQQIISGLDVRVVISDNQSTDATRDIARGLTFPTTSDKATQAPTIETGSIAKSVGSARKVGVESAIAGFHKDLGDQADPARHIIVNLDADTQFRNPHFLEQLVQAFADPRVQVVSPMLWHAAPSVTEHTLDRFLYINQLKNPYLLRWLGLFYMNGLFKRQQRKREHYMQRPDLFGGALLAIRESAYTNLTSGFHENLRTGEDLRLSLELQRVLERDEVVISRRLRAYTSARGDLSPSGRISYTRALAHSVEEHTRHGHTPAVLANEQELPTQTHDSVVAAFIHDMDQLLYTLKPHEYVEAVVRGKRKSMRRGQGGRIVPAMSAISGREIPGYFAIIREV